LDASWQALLEHREYPQMIRDVLGEAVAASALLAATIKFDGLLTMQLKGDGPMPLLLAQCTSGLNVRGLARYREHDDRLSSDNIRQLAGAGNLTVTLESEDLKQRYQGIVPLIGTRLAQCLEVYFAQSEQLPTRLWLQANEHGAAGMLLQRLPTPQLLDDVASNLDAAEIARQREQLDDAWSRVQLIGDTLKPEELFSLADREILQRLFHEDDLRLFEASPVYFRCRCSRERVIGVLQALGEAEVKDVISEQGKVEVRCDFCNRAYTFDAVDVAQLFAENVSGTGGQSRH
jgi:molecular chaperone Hsp33